MALPVSSWHPCATPKTTDVHQVSPTTPRTEIGPARPGQPDVEARTTSSRAKAACHAPQNHQHTADPRNLTDLDAEIDRSRCGLRPISVRVATDLDAGCDRSRCGDRPISARVTTDLEPECDRSRRRGRLGGPKKRGTRRASTDRWTPLSLGRLSQVSYLVHKIETRGTFSCDPDQQPH